MSDLILKSALEMLYIWERQQGNKIFLRQPEGDRWHELTWSEVGRQARCMARVLNTLGCQEGDRVALLSKNCAQWIIADLAIMMAGCVSVPLYATQPPDSIQFVLDHSEAKVIFVGKVEQADKVDIAIPDSIPRIAFPYADGLKGTLKWNDLIENTVPLGDNYVPGLDNLATIIYTSGTTGFPKGVMHTFRSIAHAAVGYKENNGFDKNDRLFSYLPLSHVAERVLVEMIGLYCGATISFAESLETFSRNLQSVSPTAFFSVPRLWMKFQQGVLEKIPQEKLTRLLKIPVVSTLVKYKIKKGLGLHKARLIGSGAAPIAPSLLRWFEQIGVEILEGYGLTENFGFATGTPKGEVRIGTVGRSMMFSETKIDVNGEILTKSGSNTLGYYKDPVSTEMIYSDGFLRTGDIGEIDKDGYIKITGRVKEIFKTDKGKYIAPAPIEHRFITEFPYVEQLCVTGQSLPQPVALCVLHQKHREQPSEVLINEMAEALKRLNKSLEKHEQIERCILLREEWTVDAGMMTPTLKIRRHKIEAKFQDLIAQSANSTQTIIWEETFAEGRSVETVLNG